MCAEPCRALPCRAVPCRTAYNHVWPNRSTVLPRHTERPSAEADVVVVGGDGDGGDGGDGCDGGDGDYLLLLIYGAVHCKCLYVKGSGLEAIERI